MVKEIYKFSIPASIPDNKRQLLEQLIDKLCCIPRVVAVTLGGSYARGTQHDDSDLDLGLYYFEAAPFSVREIKRIGDIFSTEASAVVTDLYEWGRWVNGGAWLETEAGKIDILYRNLDQVERTISDAWRGITQHDYSQQPAYGFYSVVYLAEIKVSIPLYDPNEQIVKLKTQVESYPSELKEKIITESLSNTELTLNLAKKYANAGDVYNTVGCLTRIAANLTQALFALNETYFISDKKAMEVIDTFANIPEDYVQKITQILAQPGATKIQLNQTLKDIEAILEQFTTLVSKQ